MIPSKLFLTLAIGLGAAACQSPYQTVAVVPSAPLTVSDQACVDYGFTPGTDAYGRCVGREREARARGRVTRDYADTQLSTDARDACYSYGLQPGTGPYDRCVGREMDARRYRDDSAAVYAPAPAYASAYSPAPTVVYNTPSYPERNYPDRSYPDRSYPAQGYSDRSYPANSYPARSYPAAPYVETRNNNGTGVPAFKDEYGFRYDAEGNRIDRNGNIISPHSTQP